MSTINTIIQLDNGGRIYTLHRGCRTTWGFSLPDGSEGSGYSTMESAQTAAAECLLPVEEERESYEEMEDRLALESEFAQEELEEEIRRGRAARD